MSARLVPLNDQDAPPIMVQRPVMLIGRHPECDIRIDREQISRRHCCLAQAYDRVLIRDLGSRNGVRVNGRMVVESRLVPGDEVAIAHLIYRLEADPARPPAHPASGGQAGSARPAPPNTLPPAPPGASDDDLIPLDDDFLKLD